MRNRLRRALRKPDCIGASEVEESESALDTGQMQKIKPISSLKKLAYFNCGMRIAELDQR